ncbi:MAG: hypothetical protein RRA92_05505 [Gemmatimonadota bacterium]|nr:hypothetical protein [Gemmatimonadota bacterium]
MTQHAGLTEERWAGFDLDSQVLMIANEMYRTTRLLGADGTDARRRGYERVLRLTDLTIAPRFRPGLRRELLRWRDLAAALYVSARPDPPAHAEALRALLRLRPNASKQIPLLLG